MISLFIKIDISIFLQIITQIKISDSLFLNTFFKLIKNKRLLINKELEHLKLMNSVVDAIKVIKTNSLYLIEKLRISDSTNHIN